MSTATYQVSGMTCEHCVHAISQEVGNIDGVDKVDVQLADGSMTVTSQAPIDFAKIAEAVDEAGEYQVSQA